MNASARRIGWTLLTGLACSAPLAATHAAPFAGGPTAPTQAPTGTPATPPAAPLPPEPAPRSAQPQATPAESPRDTKPNTPVTKNTPAAKQESAKQDIANKESSKQESTKQESGLFGGLSSLASKALPSTWAAKPAALDPAVAAKKPEPKPELKTQTQPAPKPEAEPAREPRGLIDSVAATFSFGWGASTKDVAPKTTRPDAAAAPTAAAREAAPQAQPRAALARPQPQPRPTAQTTSPAATATGRFDPTTFDPSVGLAGHFVSDADERLAQATVGDDQFLGSPRPMAPARPVATPIPTDDEPLQSAVVTDEEVSLASWLANSYNHYTSGGGQHGGHCPTGRLGDRCCPKWEAQVDALFFWQGNLPSRPLYVDSATGATALDANQLQSKAAIAPRYAITYNRDECRAIEVNYFQLWGFTSQQQLGPALDAAGNGPFTAADLVNPPYDQIAGAIVTSSAHIQSLEVNLRRTDGGMIEWISGFRWLEWGQQLGIGDVGASGGFIDGADVIGITTLNNLYGWQWGADMMLWNAGRWVRINGVAKAGVYYNHQAAQNTTYTDFFNPDVNVRDGEDTVSFVGETGLNASFALTNWLSWRAGYTFLWLGGVATPTGQLGLTDITTSTSAVNSNGSAYLHGVTTGLEARW